MTRHFTFVLFLSALALGVASVGNASSISRAADSVATITGITPAGVVTATDATRRAYSFEVKDPALLRSLKAGQQVMVSTATGSVAVPGAEQCCRLLPAVSRQPALLQRQVAPLKLATPRPVPLKP